MGVNLWVTTSNVFFGSFASRTGGLEDWRTGGLDDWMTEPYTPQQNGKMEKWWDALEKGVKNRQQIADFVKYYNGCWTITAFTSRPVCA
jgi:hypothetical protein